MSSLSSPSDLESKDVHTKQHTSYDDTARPTQAKNYPDYHKSSLIIIEMPNLWKVTQGITGNSMTSVLLTWGLAAMRPRWPAIYSKQSILMISQTSGNCSFLNFL